VGITVHRDHFDKFREAFNASLADSQGEIPPSTLEIDQIINFEALTPQFLEQYELFEPFGMGNPQPLFFSSEVYPAEEPKRLKEKHLKMTLTQNGLRRDAIYFSAPLELPEPPWDIAYHFERNEFRGKVYLQLQIKAIRATSPLEGNKLFTQLP